MSINSFNVIGPVIALLFLHCQNERPAATAFLSATATAGISSGTYHHHGPGPGPREGRTVNAGAETLALRQTHRFQTKAVLLKFDVSSIKGWTIKDAYLHVAMARGDLFGIGLCTVLNEWNESAACWDFRALPEKKLWAYPGSRIHSVAWMHPALRYSHSGPDDIERHKDSAGVLWLRIKIDPDMVHAMAAGGTCGLVMTDDKGQVAEGLMLAQRASVDSLLPYRYDPSFDPQIFSRHAKEGGLAPKLEVVGGPGSKRPPTGVRKLRQDRNRLYWIAPENAFAYRIRRSDREITDENWAQAVPLALCHIPRPAGAGREQAMPLDYLKTLDGQYIGIRAVDRAGNPGPLSSIKIEFSKKALRTLGKKEVSAATKGKKTFEGGLRVWAAGDLVKINPVSGKLLPENAAETDLWDPAKGRVKLRGAGNEVVSFQLALERTGKRLKNIKVDVTDLIGPDFAVIETEKCLALFKEWYFKPQWLPDACLPLGGEFAKTFDIPGMDNVGKKQKNQAVWADLYIPKDARPGEYRGEIRIGSSSLSKPAVLELLCTVRPFALPDAFTWDVSLNDYSGIDSTSKISRIKDSANYFLAEKRFYQLAQRHRASLSMLPYSQTGGIRQTVPEIKKEGKEIHVADWTAYDRRYGKYFDGTAFTPQEGYRGPGRGVPARLFYLPFFENWPVSLDEHYPDAKDLDTAGEFAEWAKSSRVPSEDLMPAYSRDFKAIAKSFAEHFAEKGWNRTRFQFFFNNKYYFKLIWIKKTSNLGTSYWCLDEPVDYDDFAALRYFFGLSREGAALAGAPGVQFEFRADISRPQLSRGLLDGACDAWIVRLDPVYADARYRKKWFPRESWWCYSGNPGPDDPPAGIVRNYLFRYCAGATGDVSYWSTFDGRSWTRENASNSLYYTGYHYAGTDKVYAGALPGIRLKVMRRGQQDMEYLNLLVSRAGWAREDVVNALLAWARTDRAGRPDFDNLGPAGISALRETVARELEAVR